MSDSRLDSVESMSAVWFSMDADVVGLFGDLGRLETELWSWVDARVPLVSCWRFRPSSSGTGPALILAGY